MARSRLALVSPTTENRTVRPVRRPNVKLRTREHLTASEVEAVLVVARATFRPMPLSHRSATKRIHAMVADVQP
jgi:hypothetical protein